METDNVLFKISESVPRARSLEELTRPLLDILAAATDLESTYLTTVDVKAGVQHVQFVRNAGELQIPEGLDVPWEDTLCKRALDEGRLYTGDVAECWGDSDAARELGIQTYVSAPVRTHDGELLGTLCAASSARRPLMSAAVPMLQLFSKLIGSWVERERLIEHLRTANSDLASLALTDVLTGLPNRRAIVDELGRFLARAKREGHKVLVGLIDLDGFKAVNDTLGHHAGDQLLTEAARRMREALRATDLLGRVGGDEFVVLAPGPHDHDANEAAALMLQNRLSQATVGTYSIGTEGMQYSGASVGVVAVEPLEVGVEEALRMADGRMYAAKATRKRST